MKKDYLKLLIDMTTDKSFIVTDEILDDLMSDWLERDGDTFVHKRKKGRIGWEDTLGEGEAYSAYLLESPTQEDLIKRAYSLAKETIVVMDPPFKVSIKISTGIPTGGTDGKVVCVTTAMFDDKSLTVGEKLDTFLGVVVHEGCHLLYTDMSWLKRVAEVKSGVIMKLWNIIEDERIERLCGDLKPGLANFLEKCKLYYFDQYYLDYVAPKEESAELTPLERILNCFLSIIRYPKYLKESEIIEFAPYLIEIKKILNPYPITTEDAVKAAYMIFEVIKDFYKEIEREKSPEATDDELERKAISDMSSHSDAMDSEGKFSKVAGSPTSVPASDGGGGGLSKKDLSKSVSGDSELLAEVCEGRVEVGSEKDSFFSKIPDNKEIYLMAEAHIKRYVPAISKILKGHCKEYKLIHRSMRSGILDTNKLAEAVQGVPTVYIREGEVKTDKVSVCVLIDESGSMCGNRIEAARDTAILINEAVGSVPNVELFIYGHSGDSKRERSTELMVYREKGYTPKYSLGSVDARYQNRDGNAILETAKRVRKQTKNPVLMFVLSDGAPCAGGYRGASAMRHVKECVHKVEKMGFSVIQVCISHTYDPGLMFKNYVIMEDMSSLAFDLGKAIKKATMAASKVHIL